ncbi:MAG: hypothetical protein JWM23_299 [Microbacteriaceae bacterium]|jgi:hypothetical protein|nr:hypothetical protein [Microbacteriaceae bacterium]
MGGMDNGTQDAPVEHGSFDGSVDQKKQGILIQVAVDTVGQPRSEVVAMLTQRLGEAGLPADAAEIDDLARNLPSVGSQEEAENRGARESEGDLPA